MMIRTRRQRGSIAMGAVLALALVVLGVGFLVFSLYMGGQSETKNAVDAGTLNVGKQVLDNVSVNLTADANQQCFKDLTNDTIDGSELPDGKINLRRINRVWAKALLMTINAEAANNDGNAGSGSANAQQAFNGAQLISNSLADKLTNSSSLFGFFSDFAKKNSVRMIGKDASVDILPGSNWQTSLLEREKESNISLSGSPPNFNLPPNFELNPNFTTKTTRIPVPQGGEDLWFLRGYTPITVGQRTFWHVPFLYAEKPHLVSRSVFDGLKASASPLLWNKPVPNSFSAEGAAVKPGEAGQKAMSWVLTNPNQPFKLSMPHSFLHIKVDEMKSHWYFFPTGYPPVEFGPRQTYGYTTDSQTGSPMPQGGVLCASVAPVSITLGLDVVGRNLDQIIFGPPAGNTAKVEQYMVNRINEMVSKVGVSKSPQDLHNVLANPSTIGWLIAGERDFYVFSPDGEALTVQPKNLAIAQAPWLLDKIANNPDGTETKLIDDASMPAPIFFTPTVVPDPFCSPLLQLGWGFWDKDVAWTPGSGYNSCLGRIRVKRWTEVYSLGICTFL